MMGQHAVDDARILSKALDDLGAKLSVVGVALCLGALPDIMQEAAALGDLRIGAYLSAPTSDAIMPARIATSFE